MLNKLDLERVVVLDIETVSQNASYTSLDSEWKELWDLKAANLKRKEEEDEETLYKRAGIYAEFGKVVCISVGFFRAYDDHYQFRIKSFYGDDEKAVLSDFAQLLDSRFHGKQFLLAAHNGKEFDFPYLARRMVIQGISLPLMLDHAGKKPWEVPHLDTMELWKFGDFKHYTSLKLLAKVLGIPTPKDDIDGSMVGEVYWKEQDLERIKVYCQKDVITVAQMLLRFSGKRLLKQEELIFADQED
ncbi:MAG: 3'-5' exonuclease [Bacteroidetes bacterium]|nr:MAG: 3'-5' exonuclease [Bacteroidota bacterium]